ncbi:LytR C-terminal domain-containing protein [Candidatus Curtissbacteria bacterium]|nr:LytR C-terminal domain-containing protein [Candidatus Curtissbacteria bacterium]
MIKYPLWKRQEIRSKWRNILSIFIVIVLVFAIINGLTKSISLKKYFGEGRWDGESSFVATFSTSPPSLFIYQSDPKRVVFLTVDPNLFFVTGKQDKPIMKIGEIKDKYGGEELLRIMSLNFRAKIDNFVIFKNNQTISETNVEKLFGDFKSFVSPMLYFTKRELLDTNISRIDMTRLWWQLKGVGVNQMQLVDMSNFHEEIVLAKGVQVLGVDSVSLNRKIKDYLENPSLAEFEVEIQNGSGSGEAGDLAVDFMASMGFSVKDIFGSNQVGETVIFAKKNFATSLLAKIFNCDIKALPKEARGDDSGKIIIAIGQDFANKYFE